MIDLEKQKSTVIVGECNTSLSLIERIPRQKISKDVDDLDNTSSHLYLFYMCRIVYPTAAKYTFLQMHMAHSPSETIFWAIKEVSISLKD